MTASPDTFERAWQEAASSAQSAMQCSGGNGDSCDDATCKGGLHAADVEMPSFEEEARSVGVGEEVVLVLVESRTRDEGASKEESKFAPKKKILKWRAARARQEFEEKL